MRGEAIWVVQFIGMLGVLALVFLIGVAVGRRRAVDPLLSGPSPIEDAPFREVRGRLDLFAPEFAEVVDVREGSATAAPDAVAAPKVPLLPPVTGASDDA